MDAEVLEYLRTICPKKTYHPGEIIFGQGEDATEMYYLEHGLSLTYSIMEDGRERNILISWPGRIFGASTIFEQVPRRASAIALKRCEVLVIGRAAYLDCCEKCPRFQTDMIIELSRDIGILFEELADSSLLTTEIKVARFLCRRMVKGQHTMVDGRFNLKYTQDFIANVLGISRLSVNQSLSSLSGMGYISTSYGSITIHQPEALRSYAYGGSHSSPAG